MLLEIQERLALMELLPREGDYASIKTIRRAREMIDFTPEEREPLKFEQKGTALVWDVKVGVGLVRDIPVDAWTTSTIQQVLINLSNEKTLTEMQLSLYEKFVVNYE
jgi:hypothetical protein